MKKTDKSSKLSQQKETSHILGDFHKMPIKTQTFVRCFGSVLHPKQQKYFIHQNIINNKTNCVSGKFHDWLGDTCINCGLKVSEVKEGNVAKITSSYLSIRKEELASIFKEKKTIPASKLQKEIEQTSIKEKQQQILKHLISSYQQAETTYIRSIINTSS